MTQTPPPSILPRVPPRFLPTLTEVVQAPVGAVHPVGASMNAEHIVQGVLQRLDGPFKAAVQTTIEDMVREQLQVLGPLLMQQIELAVRQAVHETLSHKAENAVPASSF